MTAPFTTTGLLQLCTTPAQFDCLPDVVLCLGHDHLTLAHTVGSLSTDDALDMLACTPKRQHRMY